MTDVRINEDLWWWHADGARGDSGFTGGKVQAPAFGAGCGHADMDRGGGRWRGVPPPAKSQRWVDPASLRRVSSILEVLVWRCRSRLPNVLGSFLKCLMAARRLVAGSLPVTGRS